MRIKVTKEIIEKCISERKGWYNPCPIKVAIINQFPREYVLVNGVSIHAGKKYKCPKKVIEFIVKWDKMKPVKPFSFRLIENKPTMLSRIKRYIRNIPWFRRYFIRRDIRIAKKIHQSKKD